MGFASSDEVVKYIGGIFDEAFADPEIGPKLVDTGLVVAFDFTDPDAVVVIDDGKITYAGAASGAPQIDESAKPVKVDVGGNTVTPGFFDCHVHLS